MNHHRQEFDRNRFSLIAVAGLKPVALALLVACTPAIAGDEKTDKLRVRASQPTVVTVEGHADRLKTDGSRSSLAKAAKGIQTGITGTGRAFVTFGGWLLNVKDDIPSERERQQKEGTRRL